MCISLSVALSLSFSRSLSRSLSLSILLLFSLHLILILPLYLCTLSWSNSTVTFMSPERIDGREYSYPSDVWAFGLSLMTLAKGSLPIDTQGPSCLHRYLTYLISSYLFLTAQLLRFLPLC